MHTYDLRNRFYFSMYGNPKHGGDLAGGLAPAL